MQDNVWQELLLNMNHAFRKIGEERDCILKNMPVAQIVIYLYLRYIAIRYRKMGEKVWQSGRKY